MAPAAKAYMPGLRAGSLKRHVLKTEDEEEAFTLAASPCPSWLPKLCLDNTASLNPDTKTSLLAPAGEEGSPLPPRITMTSKNFHAEQLSMQDSKKPPEDWAGWVVPAGVWIVIFIRLRLDRYS